MENGTSVLLKEREVPGGYDRTRYQVEQIYATAADGVKIPISVVHLKGAKLDGHGPLFLYGYGSYGASMDIDFDPEVFSLVDRGVAYAIAHIRAAARWARRGTTRVE